MFSIYNRIKFIHNNRVRSMFNVFNVTGISCTINTGGYNNPKIGSNCYVRPGRTFTVPATLISGVLSGGMGNNTIYKTVRNVKQI